MKTATLSRWQAMAHWCRTPRTLAISQGALGLALLSGILGIVAVGGFKAARLLKASAEPNGDVPVLDSFSEPAIAFALLKKQVEDLFESQRLARSLQSEARPGHPGSGAADPGEMKRRSMAGQIHWLHERMQMLDLNANHDRMLLSAKDCNHKTFIDCYLRILFAASDAMEIVAWTRRALDSAEACGRTAEVLDALRHVAWFGNDARASNRLSAVVETWKAGRQPSHSPPGNPAAGAAGL